MRRDLIRRLKVLEGKKAGDARPPKPMLPAWLLEDLVEQGAWLDADGQLDLAWLQAPRGSEGPLCGVR